MRHATKLLVASLGGTLMSLIIPFLLIKYHVYTDWPWTVLALGWVLFSVGRDDLFRMLVATAFDAGLYSLVIYLILHFFGVGFRRIGRRT
jgi:hypothetical protein